LLVGCNRKLQVSLGPAVFRGKKVKSPVTKGPLHFRIMVGMGVPVKRGEKVSVVEGLSVAWPKD